MLVNRVPERPTWKAGWCCWRPWCDRVMGTRKQTLSGKSGPLGAGGTPESHLRYGSWDSPDDLASRIRQAAERAGGVSKLAQVSGIPLSTLNEYLGGAKLPLERAASIARAAKVDLLWLAEGGRPMLAIQYKSGEATPSDDATVDVPIYDARASAGPGAFVDQDLVTGHMALDSGWMREVAGANAARLVMTQAVGNSMEPTIFSGDRLLVETGEGPRFHGGIYVVVFGGDIMVKRYFRGSGGSFILHSDNPAAGDIKVEEDDQTECRLVGRVRMILRVP
jgi:phage repressor protein C with HTH and peptisase S24 domain